MYKLENVRIHIKFWLRAKSQNSAFRFLKTVLKVSLKTAKTPFYFHCFTIFLETFPWQPQLNPKLLPMITLSILCKG